jgi:AraC family transcriptional regulator
MILMSTRFQDGHFVGALRSTRQVSGLTLAETEYVSGLHVPAHAHDHALCCLVLDGSFTERSGSRSTNCEPGSLIFQPQDEPHAHDFQRGGGRCFNIQFGEGWVERMERFSLRQPTSPTSLHRTRAGWLAGQLYQEFCAEDSAAVLGIEGFALALLGEIARAGSPPERRGAKPGWLLRAVEHLHAHFLDPLSLTEVARLADIDPSHLARTFRDFYGCTMSEYVRKLRVERARKDLLATDQPLSTIALSTGFTDQAHFSRVFKQLTGLTPGAFRRTAKGR